VIAAGQGVGVQPTTSRETESTKKLVYLLPSVVAWKPISKVWPASDVGRAT